jgi:hypothetical protein
LDSLSTLLGSDWLLGALGIAVSVGLFLVGYRQTVTARRERAHAAEVELERILVRRIVLESYRPTSLDLRRLIQGKARDYRIRRGDIVSEAPLLIAIFTRITETDFIPHSEREEALARLTPAITEAEGEPPTAAEVEESAQGQRLALVVPLIIAGLATLVGSLVTAFPPLANLDTRFPDYFAAVAATAGASLALIAIILVLRRFREPQEATGRSAELARYLDFERRVEKELKRTVRHVRSAGPRDRGFDYLVEHGGKKYLVEVKAWTRPLPKTILLNAAETLAVAKREVGAEHAIIVTPRAIRPRILEETAEVAFMTLDELHALFKRTAA